MNFEDAKAIVENMNANKPFDTVLEYLQCMAAFTSYYKEEIIDKNSADHKLLINHLIHACTSMRTQWYFNNLRYRHALPVRYRSLLSSGTSGNEVLNAEINQWFRNQPELYLSTLQLQLDVNVLAKLLYHESVMQAPLLRLNPYTMVLSGVIPKLTFTNTENTWADFCYSSSSLPLWE